MPVQFAGGGQSHRIGKGLQFGLRGGHATHVKGQGGDAQKRGKGNAPDSHHRSGVVMDEPRYAELRFHRILPDFFAGQDIAATDLDRFDGIGHRQRRTLNHQIAQAD